MAGTRTAPVVGALTQTSIGVTVHLIDASGDQTTDYVISDSSDLLDVEAFVAAYQPTTQASIWKVTFSQEYEGDADPDNGQALYRGSVSDGINLLFKDTAALRKQAPRVYAPVPAIMQGNQDIPLLVAPLTTLVTQYLVLMAGAFSLDSMQFTGRRERSNNPRIKT